MIELYIVDTSGLKDPKDYPEQMEGLEEIRKYKIQRFKSAEDRKESLAAGILLKKILEKHGKTVEEIHYTEAGKPVISGLCFNLSHSHGMVLCAVSEHEIGCDIEKIGAERSGIAERFFTPNESAYLDTFTGEKRAKEFYRIWTMKEAYLKMTGEGLKVPLNQVEFLLGNEVEVYRSGERCTCKIMEVDVPGYQLTIAWNSIKEETKVIDYSRYI